VQKAGRTWSLGGWTGQGREGRRLRQGAPKTSFPLTSGGSGKLTVWGWVLGGARVVGPRRRREGVNATELNSKPGNA